MYVQHISIADYSDFWVIASYFPLGQYINSKTTNCYN